MDHKSWTSKGSSPSWESGGCTHLKPARFTLSVNIAAFFLFSLCSLMTAVNEKCLLLFLENLCKWINQQWRLAGVNGTIWKASLAGLAWLDINWWAVTDELIIMTQGQQWGNCIKEAGAKDELLMLWSFCFLPARKAHCPTAVSSFF